MAPRRMLCAVAALVLFGAVQMPAEAQTQPAAQAPAGGATPVTLTIFAAGTLAVPFRAVSEAFESRNPGVHVEAEYGGSVKMARQITDLHRPADILAVADYSVIPTYLFGEQGKTAYARWYVGFARNAITFVYTPKSKYADEMTPQNWYEVLARPGVEIGRSNPDTDPSGYQTLQMLGLAASYYGNPQLRAQILANAPETNMRDTETDLISALQLGQIDYLAIYRSDALQHQLRYIPMPPQIDLSDPDDAALYAKAFAETRNGALAGKPIVYALTIPSVAAQPAWAERYIAFLLGPDGQKVLAADGFGTVHPALAVNPEAMPQSLRPLVAAWPPA
ncbi:MAG TPA: extracellular solute-binding protein [Stellaceae bacterium]|nr:extracellular solute-binding protein [Stellaceae bacterium]